MHPNDGRVVSNFIVQALQGHDITIYGNGSQTRSFCYIDDLVAGLMLMMESDDSVTGPINLGNPNEISVGTLAEEVISITGSESKISYYDIPEDDPRRRKPDISEARKVLSWFPTTDRKLGLTRTIDYFRSKND
jgi:UDP-glucuronate decarboxylase